MDLYTTVRFKSREFLRKSSQGSSFGNLAMKVLIPDSVMSYTMLQSDWLRYPLSIRQWMSSSGKRNDEHKLVFTKTIRLFALNFYETIVNYHFIEIECE